MSYRIYDSQGSGLGLPMAEIIIDDEKYGFSLLSIDKSDREWLVKLLHSDMQEVHSRAYKKGKNDIRKQMKATLIEE